MSLVEVWIVENDETLNKTSFEIALLIEFLSNIKIIYNYNNIEIYATYIENIKFVKR